MEIYLRREKRGRSGGGEGGGWVGMIISVCCFWQFDFETLLRRERERERWKFKKVWANKVGALSLISCSRLAF